MLPVIRRAGLSFGDRACLALANKLGVRAITANRAWPRIGSGVGVEIELTREYPHGEYRLSSAFHLALTLGVRSRATEVATSRSPASLATPVGGGHVCPK